MTPLSPVSAKTLADAVELRIYDFIRANKLTIGDVLPGEVALAAKLRVSRHIVREALSRLKMLGLVESRQRRGMELVKPDPFIGLERMATANVLDERDQLELLELRVVLELGMCDYISARITAADLWELAAIVKHDRPERHYLPEMHKLEYQFHAKLYQVSGNETLRRLHGILGPFLSILRNQRFVRKIPSLPSHQDLYELLNAGDAAGFRDAMHRHLNVYLPEKHPSGRIWNPIKTEAVPQKRESAEKRPPETAAKRTRRVS